MCTWSINPLTNPSPVYSHTHSRDNINKSAHSYIFLNKQREGAAGGFGETRRGGGLMSDFTTASISLYFYSASVYIDADTFISSESISRRMLHITVEDRKKQKGSERERIYFEILIYEYTRQPVGAADTAEKIMD
jgi:hypothetical protein